MQKTFNAYNLQNIFSQLDFFFNFKTVIYIAIKLIFICKKKFLWNFLLATKVFFLLQNFIFPCYKKISFPTNLVLHLTNLIFYSTKSATNLSEQVWLMHVLKYSRDFISKWGGKIDHFLNLDCKKHFPLIIYKTLFFLN